uniref:G_PROTEIN_RECEP_F1_2 domain-containing protein n=1 Tax=Macrostomum lignano TaxID=282301 RepID=A0A1I8F620_9PLAT
MQRPALCIFVASLCLTACYCSLLSLGAIAINRYIHICHPARYRSVFTRRSTLATCAALWIVSFLLEMPNFLGWGGHAYDWKRTSPACGTAWPPGPTPSSSASLPLASPPSCAHSNSSVNFLVYGLTNREFLRGYQEALRRLAAACHLGGRSSRVAAEPDRNSSPVASALLLSTFCFAKLSQLNRREPLKETMSSSEQQTSSHSRRVLLLNLFFGFLAVAGQVGQNVSLPLWIDSGNSSAGGELSADPPLLLEEEEPLQQWVGGGPANCTVGRSIDSYFVYTFACTSFVLIFGLLLIPIKLLSPSSLDRRSALPPARALPHRLLRRPQRGVLVVFASSGKRTLPALQPILSNFMIPLSVTFRLGAAAQGLAALGVFLALVVSLLPMVPSLGAETEGGARGIGRVLWPVVFMLGFVPAAVMNVLQEKWLKHRLEAAGGGQLNLIFFLFSTSCYQLLTALALFWVDILGDSWRFGVSCFFGGDGCPADSGVRGAMFIGMYTVSYIGGGLMLRYAEGATLLAVVSALVTPLGFLFWTFFQEDPFQFHIQTSYTTWFALASLSLMVPAILAYNWRSEAATKPGGCSFRLMKPMRLATQKPLGSTAGTNIEPRGAVAQRFSAAALGMPAAQARFKCSHINLGLNWNLGLASARRAAVGNREIDSISGLPWPPHPRWEPEFLTGQRQSIPTQL